MALRGAGIVLLVLVAGLGAPTEAPAQQFTNFYVFGDSLSDAGTYRFPVDGALLPMKFTVNPYPVWNQVLGERYGITVSPYLATNAVTETSVVVGGTNYAQGGACTNSAFSLTECPVFPLNTLGEAQQIGTYLASTGGRADPNALYSAWAGANNIFGEATLIEGGKPVAAALASVAAAAQDHVQNIGALSQAGARYIIVPNLPNIALTPSGAASPEAGAYYAASVGIYNAVLNEGLAQLGGSNLIYADMYRVLTEVYSDPARYGLSNVTGMACATPSSILCTTATLTAPGAQFNYLFADDVHPTPATHAMLAQYVASILAAPGLIGLLADAPVSAGQGIFRTLDSRLDAPAKAGWQLYSNADYSSYDAGAADNRSGADGSAVGGYLGLEHGDGNGLSVGALLNLSHGSYDFGSNSGGFDADMFAATLYANLHLGGFYGQLSGTLGTLSYDDVERQFVMGAAMRSNSGDTDGSYYAARLATGYDMTVGAFSAGPIGQLSYQRVNVDSYAEAQDDSSAMGFGSQESELFFGTVGGRAVYAFELAGARLKALAQATYNTNFLDGGRVVNAGLIGAPVTFDMPVYAPGDSWTDLRLGLAAEIGASALANLMVGTQFRDDEDTAWYGNLGVTYRF